MRVKIANLSGGARAAGAVVALLLCLLVWTPLAPRAQRTKEKERAVNVTNVSSRADARGAVVTVTGDAPLSRAQTWQDDEGFHVVGYRWSLKAGLPRGVRVRQVGESLELVVPVRRGGSVTVQPRGDALDLVVNGGLGSNADADASRDERAQRNSHSASAQPAGQSSRAAADSRVRAIERRTAERQRDLNEVPPTLYFSSQSNAGGDGAKAGSQANEDQSRSDEARAKPEGSQAKPEGAQSSAAQTPAETMNAGQFQEAAPQGTPAVADPATLAPTPDPNLIAQAAPQPAQVQQQAVLATAAATTGGGGMKLLAVALVAFLVAAGGTLAFVRQRQRAESRPDAPESTALVKVSGGNQSVVVAAQGKASAAKDAKQGGAKNGKQPNSQPANNAQPNNAQPNNAQPNASRPNGAALAKHDGARGPQPVSYGPPPVLFGAFRVEQEVEKLIKGLGHSVEVLASRAHDDRRALEACLLKHVGAQHLEECERARVRVAFEEYGFVARQSAALLLAPDAFTRSSAARALGQIGSASSLPFLLEALYDSDPVVRTEAVTSLGALGSPAAIGALLDMARRHPELPPQLLGSALSACSVETIEMTSDGAGGYVFAGDLFNGEINDFEPVAEVEQLPVWLEDETLAEALDRLESADVEARVAAAQQLAQYSVQRSVEALSLMASRDRAAAVRAAAVTSLGLIGHESVFAPVVIAMADEAREVRASAARALSRLSFDRADAYVRVIEAGNMETTARLAGACVTAGLVRQALDRLASEDRRQAYEAFSLLSLVARGGQAGVILDTVEGAGDLKVRMAAARLLVLQGGEEVAARLRVIAAQPDAPEELRAAICEVGGRAARADAGAGAVAGGETLTDAHAGGVASESEGAGVSAAGE